MEAFILGSLRIIQLNTCFVRLKKEREAYLECGQKTNPQAASQKTLMGICLKWKDVAFLSQI